MFHKPFSHRRLLNYSYRSYENGSTFKSYVVQPQSNNISINIRVICFESLPYIMRHNADYKGFHSVWFNERKKGASIFVCLKIYRSLIWSILKKFVRKNRFLTFLNIRRLYSISVVVGVMLINFKFEGNLIPSLFSIPTDFILFPFIVYLKSSLSTIRKG
jgi:hypothetical protein